MPPPVTPRTPPTGLKIDTGHRCTFACAANPAAHIWEKSITMPGTDGGDAIDTSTMWNTDWRTFISRTLKTLTEGQIRFAFTGVTINEINALVNVETGWTIYLPNGGSLSFWAFLRTVDGAQLEVDGPQPEMTGHFHPTNTNPNTGAEEGPLYTPPSASGAPP